MPDFVFWNEVIIPLAGMATGVVIVTIIAGIVRHARQAGANPAEAGEAKALRAELESLRSHVEAIEERLDFAERLLIKERGREQVGPG